jgi:DNA-binding SARP family transcriptional activator
VLHPASQPSRRQPRGQERQVNATQSSIRAAQDRLIFREPGYVLRVAPGELDLAEFRRLADEGSRLLAAGDAERASPVLHAALRLWRGRPLEHVDLPALSDEVAALEERRLAVLERRIETDLLRGRHAELVPELEVLARMHRLRERLRCQQVLAQRENRAQWDPAGRHGT